MGYIEEETRSEISITFLKNKKANFIEFLKENNISFEQIDYKNKKKQISINIYKMK
jgi:hypothetical protein